MEQQLNELTKKWNINSFEKSATHIGSGLTFKYISNDNNNHENIEISGMPKWFSYCIEHGFKQEQNEEILNELVKEFVKIYEEIISPQNINCFEQIIHKNAD